jgi:hypothetical protein
VNRGHFIPKEVDEDGENSSKKSILVNFITSWVAREELVGRTNKICMMIFLDSSETWMQCILCVVVEY